MAYVVRYDLSKSEQDYPQLLEYLHLIGARRLLDSQWMVRSGATRDAVYQGIRAQIDSNHALLVCLVGSAVGANLKHPLGEIWVHFPRRGTAVGRLRCLQEFPVRHHVLLMMSLRIPAFSFSLAFLLLMSATIESKIGEAMFSFFNPSWSFVAWSSVVAAISARFFWVRFSPRQCQARGGASIRICA
jgi:hypothetical protein